MVRNSSLFVSLLCTPAISAFLNSHVPTRSTLRMTSDAAEKAMENFKDDKAITEYDEMIKSMFPGAISNKDLEIKVCDVLAERGFTEANTLLATSLCSDELARQLEYDFVNVFGNNFNLGGLAGFPFAGNTGFAAMASHIPEEGVALIVYGPHVGVSHDGTIGKVERSGIGLVDNCCASAILASNYVKGICEGGALITTKIQEFTDFQQAAVQELILPHGRRLTDSSERRMTELPYALYESQDLLMRDIVKKGSFNLKKDIILLGGIQINTAPDALDYFLPRRFDLISNRADYLEEMLHCIKY